MIPVCACKIRRFRNQTPMNTGRRVFPAIPPPLPRRFAACPCFPALSRVPRSENTTENHTPATIGKPSASRHHRTPRRHRCRVPRPACQRASRGDRGEHRNARPRRRKRPRPVSGSEVPATVRPRRRNAAQPFDRPPPVSDSGDRAPPPSNAATVRPCAAPPDSGKPWRPSAPPVSRKPWRPCAAPPVYPASRPALDRTRRPFDRPPPSPETRRKRPPLRPPQVSGK